MGGAVGGPVGGAVGGAVGSASESLSFNGEFEPMIKGSHCFLEQETFTIIA